MQYYSPGVRKSNLVKTFSKFGPDFTIMFEMKITKMPVGWYNVLHLTTGANCCGAGTRNPAVMLSSRNGKPFLEANVGVTRRIHHNIPLELNKQYSVELVQTAGLFRVKINGKQVWQVHSGSATFRNVKYYWSDPWHHSAGEVAILSKPNIRQGLYLICCNLITVGTKLF